MTTFRPLAQRFWEKVDRRGPNECWPWTACLDRNGYGRLGMSGKNGLATHAALILDGRPRPEGAHALHRCGNRACVNPEHLRWGTAAENMKDKIADGNQPRGVSHGLAKLDDRKVREIRSATGTQRAIAARFGISQPLVSHVRRRTIWRHVA